MTHRATCQGISEHRAASQNIRRYTASACARLRLAMVVMVGTAPEPMAPRRVGQVMPMLVSPPESSGSDTYPASRASVKWIARSKVVRGGVFNGENLHNAKTGLAHRSFSAHSGQRGPLGASTPSR